VARGWGIPAVVGAAELTIDGTTLSAGGIQITAGDVITIDGTSGCVWRGTVEPTTVTEDAVRRTLPQLLQLEDWAKEHAGAPA
jgi:pyruvate,orthophosphate dikinase